MSATTNIIVFFELTDYALLRFPLWLSIEMQKKKSKLYFVYIHLYHYKKTTFNLNKLPQNSSLYSLNGNIQNIDTILEGYRNNSILFTFALRPPEFYVVNRAACIGIPTNIVQHGIFVPFMKRTLSYFIEELKKLILYSKSIYAFSAKNEVGFLNSMTDIINIYIRGKKSLRQSVFCKHNILPSNAFVYSEYWKEYFINNYGFKNNQFMLIGSPDLQDFSKIAKEEQKEATCYICQTLVEDGRISKDTFIEFVNTFSNSMKDSDVLYLKLHPRTNLNLYNNLIRRKNTILVKDPLPNCKRYIGHYSTLLMLPLTLTGNVFLWSFIGHEIPEYFNKTTSFIGNSKPILEKFIRNNVESPPKKNLLQYYFNSPNLNSYKIICELINI